MSTNATKHLEEVQTGLTALQAIDTPLSDVGLEEELLYDFLQAQRQDNVLGFIEFLEAHEPKKLGSLLKVMRSVRELAAGLMPVN